MCGGGGGRRRGGTITGSRPQRHTANAGTKEWPRGISGGLWNASLWSSFQLCWTRAMFLWERKGRPAHDRNVFGFFAMVVVVVLWVSHTTDRPIRHRRNGRRRWTRGRESVLSCGGCVFSVLVLPSSRMRFPCCFLSHVHSCRLHVTSFRCGTPHFAVCTPFLRVFDFLHHHHRWLHGSNGVQKFCLLWWCAVGARPLLFLFGGGRAAGFHRHSRRWAYAWDAAILMRMPVVHHTRRRGRERRNFFDVLHDGRFLPRHVPCRRREDGFFFSCG